MEKFIFDRYQSNERFTIFRCSVFTRIGVHLTKELNWSFRFARALFLSEWSYIWVLPELQVATEYRKDYKFN